MTPEGVGCHRPRGFESPAEARTPIATSRVFPDRVERHAATFSTSFTQDLIHEESMTSPESEARKALNRLLRAVEKSRREMESLAAAIRHAEGDDFPTDRYDEVADQLDLVTEFVHEEGRRLQNKILQAGGLEPGRVRRSST